MKDNLYTISIIGAGSIGALKAEDKDNPKTAKLLTHAHAITQNKNFDLRLIIDADRDKSIQAARRWGTVGAVSLQAVNAFDNDVFVVAVNTKNHFDVLLNIAKLEKLPKLVIIEKPFCVSSGQAAFINHLYQSQGIKLMVNYSRRYSQDYQDFYNFLKSQEVQHVTIYYNRGLRHDGCHAIDLCNWWFGRCLDMSLNKSIEPILDYPEGGRSYSVSLKYEKCPSVSFIPMDYHTCGIFEMNIFTKKNRHIFANYGEYIVNIDITENKTYGQKNNLEWSIAEIWDDSQEYAVHSAHQTDLHYMLANLYRKAEEVLKSDKLSDDGIATPEDAIRVHTIIENIDMMYERMTW